MVHHPRVSVIIPTFQCDRYIRQAIESVLIQSDCSFEIIIIDDGSTDDTKAVITTLIAGLPTAKQQLIWYYYQSNQGVCAARNCGIRHANGEFIVFLDADDYFLPNKLSQQVAHFDQNSSLGIVHTGWRIIHASGEFIKDIQPWEQAPELNLTAWLRFKPVLPSAMMFRKSWLQKVGGFNPNYQVAEDVDLTLRLALAGCQADWLKKETVAYRQHQTNTMKDGNAQLRDVPRVMAAFFSQPNLPESIQLIKSEVLFNTWIWLACYSYSVKNIEGSFTALNHSVQYSPYVPSETVIHWIESFSTFSREQDISFNPLHLTQLESWKILIQRTLFADT